MSIRIMAFVVVAALLSGCTSYSLQTADGKNTVTDSSPLDSVVAISNGYGCTVPNPYVAPPAPAPAPVVATSLCDSNGKNCATYLRATAPDPSTLCYTTVAQTKGIGWSGALAVGASIFSMIGLALGGF